MNSVSKSGTNAFHGSAHEFLRNSAMDARNEFDPKNIPAFRRNQFGGSLGGPVVKDKAFFFVNYEGIKQTLGEAKVAFTPGCLPNCAITATNPATAAAVAGALALYPLPQTPAVNGVSTATEVASQVATENYVIGRFDYNLSDKDSLFARYISDASDFNEPFAGTGGSTAIPLWPDADVSHNQFSTAQWRRIINPSLINVVRASFSRPAANEPVAPTHSALQDFPGAGRADAIVNVSNLSTLGPNLFNPFVLHQNKYLEGDDIYWTHGAHSMKMGMSVQRFDSNTFLQQFGGVQWTFTSLGNFLAGTPQRAIGTPVGPQYYGNRDFREIDLTPYIEDDWKVTSKLTLNLGLRWEFQTNPVEPQGLIYLVPDIAHDTGFVNVPHMTKTNPSWMNFDPRVGLAFDPFADHKTSIRAGFGMFHDMITPNRYWPALTQSAPWPNLTALNPFYPTPSLASGLASNTVGWDYNTDVTPYMIQYNVNIQREVAAGTVLSVGYVGARGVHLFNGTDVNAPVPTIDANGVYHYANVINGNIVANPRLNPLLGAFDDNLPAAYSRYSALQTSLNRRLTRNVEVQANYTWSNCMDNGGDGLGALNNNNSGITENPYNRTYDYGRCPQDILNAIKVNTVVTLPFKGNRAVEGWQISGIVSSSGRASL